MNASDLRALLKRVVELVMPDLRAYYRMPRKGRVVQAYASDGRYWADVQPLRNDESVDEREPIIPKVEIPILWGGPKRGVVCPPMPGTLCDITYYDGDPNYPRISNLRWAGHKAPACEVGAFVIQADPETYIKIDAERRILHLTPGDMETRIGGDKVETIGGAWTIKAPLIIQEGNVQATGSGGGIGLVSSRAHISQEGSLDLHGPLTVDSLIVRGDAVIEGNCDAASRTGGTIG